MCSTPVIIYPNLPLYLSGKSPGDILKVDAILSPPIPSSFRVSSTGIGDGPASVPEAGLLVTFSTV